MLNIKLKIVIFLTMIVVVVQSVCFYSDTAETECASVVIENGIFEMKEKINIEKFGITNDELYMIMRNIIYSNPEYFYLELNYKYSFNENNGKIISVSPSYNMTKEDANEAAIKFKKYIREIADGAENLGDAGKIAYVHDKIAENYVYDIECDVYDAYNFFERGFGLCQAYTLAFSAVLNSLNVENSWAYSETMDHIWNLVKLDEEWYHVDLTWNDAENNIYVFHDYFLLSDAEMKKREHYDWYSLYKCESTKYDNSSFNLIKKPFAFADGIYYVNSEGYVVLLSDDMLLEEKVIKCSDMWKVMKSDSEFYKGKYTGVAGIGENLYISGPKNVYRLLKDNFLENVYEYKGTDGFIYGIFENNGFLNLIISSSPNDSKALFYYILSGDSDDNGILDNEDIINIMKYQSGWNIAIDSEFSDINKDGSVDSKDLIMILMYIRGIESSMLYPY